MFIERSLGLGEEGHVTRRCTFNFNVDLSFLVAVMADSSTGHRSYRSSPNWNREDIVLLNARIYTLGLTACVRISAAGFSLWGVSIYGYQKCKFLFCLLHWSKSNAKPQGNALVLWWWRYKLSKHFQKAIGSLNSEILMFKLSFPIGWDNVDHAKWKDWYLSPWEFFGALFFNIFTCFVNVCDIHCYRFWKHWTNILCTWIRYFNSYFLSKELEEKGMDQAC